MKFTIDFATYSDIGKREINEDYVKTTTIDDKRCFVLCDGLGGHGMGEVASQTVGDVFDSCFESNDEIKLFLPTAFEAAQQILLAKQKENHAEMKMKTTCVSVVIDEKKAYIGHIGDSRAYVFRKNEVYKRTLDHSVPQMLALAHEIKESEIRHHPERNIVMRVLGNEWEDKQYELMKPIPLRKCQAFLLCSDGFWELIEEEDMCRLLKSSESAKEWLEAMVRVVRKNGEGLNMDNNSAIAMIISGKDKYAV